VSPVGIREADLILRQAQDEVLMVSLSNHEDRPATKVAA
jgi:hypothetical protein